MDDIGALRRISYLTLGVCTVFDAVLWLFADFDPFWNATVRDTALFGLGMGAVAWALRWVEPRVRDGLTLPWLKLVLRHAPDLFELLMFYRWIPVAVTVADYLVLPYSLPLADGWLARAELSIGLPHWRTYAWFEGLGALPVLRWIYASIEWQLPALLIFALVFTRSTRRLWEYVAVVSVAGVASTVFLWAFPAEGPWAFYQGMYTNPPAEPHYLPVLRALRAGELIDLTTVHGFLNFPSFHTVFALLIARTVRGFGPLTVAVFTLDALVVVSTVPVGWHYLVDVVGGVAWTLASVWFVERWAAWLRTRPA
ncbi:MAG: phosphatase PAP2 family protein [Myxococcota bacterium]